MTKTIRLNLRLTERTQGKLAELQRLLSARLGTQVSKTQAIEAAIDQMVEAFNRNPKQNTLI